MRDALCVGRETWDLLSVGVASDRDEDRGSCTVAALILAPLLNANCVPCSLNVSIFGMRIR